MKGICCLKLWKPALEMPQTGDLARNRVIARIDGNSELVIPYIPPLYAMHFVKKRFHEIFYWHEKLLERFAVPITYFLLKFN